MTFYIFKKVVKMTGLLLCFGAHIATAQSTLVLVSPTGDGGFENGADFASNGWTVENYTSNNVNKWKVGDDTKSAGDRSAYISNNNNTNVYTFFGSSGRSRVMFWRDIVFPPGYTSVTLSFKIKVQGRASFDDLSVFFQNGNNVPSTAQPNISLGGSPFIGSAARIATISMQGTQYVTRSYNNITTSALNPGNANTSTTRRLIFYWENHGGGGTQPPASIDEISVTATSTCTPPAITSFSGNYSCGPGAVTLNATTVPGATLYWYGSPAASTPLGTGNTFTTPVLTSTTDYYISAKQGNCETSSPRQIVTANIRSLPDVDLGDDIERCSDLNDSALLDAGTLPDNPTFLWNDGQTGSSRYVHQSGTYIVVATDQYNCTNADTVTVKFKQIPVVNLGDDVSICVGGSTVLNAGNVAGASYLWNTGSTAQQIAVQSSGNFSVKVTSEEGCSDADTILVAIEGQAPAIDGIIISNDGFNTFSFTADNPRNVIAYDWNFGDGSLNSTEESPTHTYPAPGNYMVTLTLESTCTTDVYTQSTNIVGVRQLDVAKDALLITPNPARNGVVIANKGVFKMDYIEIYDVIGRMVYSKKADSPMRHYLETTYWNGGTYMVKIISNEGAITRKLQLLR